MKIYIDVPTVAYKTFLVSAVLEEENGRQTDVTEETFCDIIKIHEYSSKNLHVS